MTWEAYKLSGEVGLSPRTSDMCDGAIRELIDRERGDDEPEDDVKSAFWGVVPCQGDVSGVGGASR